MDERESSQPIDVLLVEDNPGDVRLMIETFKDCKLNNNLSVVGDGEEAMAFLRQEGKYADAVRPDLVLLDLNLPKKNGREVLEEIREDHKLKHLPVVILTISKAEEDILRAYDLKADDYLTKPVDLDQFIWTVRFIDELGFSIVRMRKS